jgi:predicted transcriptional regulator with HTH domain
MRSIVLYAFSSGEVLTIMEVCKKTGLCRSSVTGAIKGAPNRFLIEDSLLYLGMLKEIEMSNDGRAIGHQITELGKAWISSENKNRCNGGCIDCPKQSQK